MKSTFFKTQTDNLSQAFEAFEKATSRDIRTMKPKECLSELSTVPISRKLILDLLAAQEIGADDDIAKIFGAYHQFNDSKA